MCNKEILIKAYQTWTVFEEWTLANGKVFTEYEKVMFQWLAIFGAAQEPTQWNDIAPDEVFKFVDSLMNGEYFM